ncbi:unnamed protein product [Euphydryas editha]|uniref:Uncharacterized protein n=1 Tax=Euphydryas editha TaxID=104508 RepID=A0AAU9U4T7_EUPED|nr:unnamed protein product [Euphydryas editha]
MLRFLGFRASVNFSQDKGTVTDNIHISSGLELVGAYKSNTEFIDNVSFREPAKRITPAMVKLPNLQPVPSVKLSKSSNNVSTAQNETTNIRNSAPDLQQTNSNVKLTKSQIREQKNLEKKRLAEQAKRNRLAAQEQKKRDKAAQEQLKKDKLAAEKQAKRDKLAAQEQQKREKKVLQEQQKRDKLAAQEKLKRDKLAAQEQKKQEKLRNEAEKNGQQARTSQNRNKATERPISLKQVPVPPPMPGLTNPQTQRPAAYSTNTLDSSISKSSGPPPYSTTVEGKQNTRDMENISFSKPASDSGSWDMISQHRQQLQRPANVGKTATKQTHLDLNYNVASSNVTKDNSEA